jgi:hypothetical protein
MLAGFPNGTSALALKTNAPRSKLCYAYLLSIWTLLATLNLRHKRLITQQKLGNSPLTLVAPSSLYRAGTDM